MMFTVCEHTNLKAKNGKFGDMQVAHYYVMFPIVDATAVTDELRRHGSVSHKSMHAKYVKQTSLILRMIHNIPEELFR